MCSSDYCVRGNLPALVQGTPLQEGLMRMNTFSFTALLAIGSSAVFAQQQAPEPGWVSARGFRPRLTSICRRRCSSGRRPVASKQ
jgi:hypothetical protein